mmetsp:Transcript_30135/g.73229  ORF Transcript_30135/g.73229 Transcript_30135/m.73229 type:complete len:198 (-) Transcript_30135:1032-1625(-)
MALDYDEKTQDRRANDGEAHDVEGCFVLELTEAQTETDGACVSSGSNNSSNRSRVRGVYIGNNTVRRSLSGLNEEGEEDQDGDSSSERLGGGEDQDQGTLAGEADSLRPDTALHSTFSVGLVGDEPSHAACEQVHPPEDGGDGSGTLGGLAELVTEVQRSGVVHREFDTEATCVLNEEQPGVDVECTGPEGLGGRDL